MFEAEDVNITVFQEHPSTVHSGLALTSSNEEDGKKIDVTLWVSLREG
jgi:hypothetical protein